MALMNLYREIFYISLLLANFCIYESNDIFKIPIGLFNSNEQQSSNTFLQNIFYNLNYVNLTIGTPPQTIPFQINVNSQTFSVSNKYFNPNDSSSFQNLSNKEVFYVNEDTIYGYNVKDILKINNVEKEINFIYETKTRKTDNDLPNIGLLIPKNPEEGVYPFFTSLKRAGVINSYTWTLKYFNNISILDSIYNYEKEKKPIGEFIIGDEPHNYENNKSIYNESEYIKTNALTFGGRLYWDFYFNSIYFKLKDNIKRNTTVYFSGDYFFTEINPDIGFIVVPNYFFNHIQNDFFNRYSEFCREKFIPKTIFRYMECDKNETFNISLFPDIYFESKEFETVFNLTYEDVCILDEKSNKYIFLFFNDRFENNIIIGSVFLRKYQFTFNVDSKTIGFYKSMNNYPRSKENQNEDKGKEEDKKDDDDEKKEEDKKDDGDEKKEEENKKDNDKDENNEKADNKTHGGGDEEKRNNNSNNNTKVFIIIGVLFLLFSILFVFLGMRIQKSCSYKRRKRMNELEDENDDFNTIEKKDRLIDDKNNKKEKTKTNDNNYNIN